LNVVFSRKIIEVILINNEKSYRQVINKFYFPEFFFKEIVKNM